MSRAIYGEWIISGTLTTVTPLAIGQGRDGHQADVDVVRDGLGRLFIPGTSLAGALRGHGLHESYFGGPRRATQTDSDRIVGSPIWMEDAPCLQESSCTSVREGVGIDRRTGAAAANLLYDFEVVEAGVPFALTLRIEAVAEDEQSREQVIGDTKSVAEDIVAILYDEFILGGGNTTGLGLVRLTGTTQLIWRDLSSRGAFLGQLAGSYETDKLTADQVANRITPGRVSIGITDKLTADQVANRITPGRVSIGIPWQAKGPLLVAAGLTGLVDSVPRVVREHGDKPQPRCRLSIPGSTLKGVFRSRAERIVRTLKEVDAPTNALDGFRQELPLIGDLFGRPASRDGKTPAAAGTLRFSEVVSNQPIDNWEEKLAALRIRPAGAEKDERKTQRRKAQDKLDDSVLMINDHVGIDRWMGGSDPGRLFADVAPWPSSAPDPDWSDIGITVDLGRLKRIAKERGASADEVDEHCRAAWVLLVLVVSDFCEGYIGIGHATTRGYGEVSADITKVRATASENTLGLWAQLPTTVDELQPQDIGAWQRVLNLVDTGKADQ